MSNKIENEYDPVWYPMIRCKDCLELFSDTNLRKHREQGRCKKVNK